MPNDNQHITILYPLCPSYSGSTLLSLLLGNQAGIYGAGELFVFSKFPTRKEDLQKAKCSCKKISYQQCDFWKKVEDYLLQHYQLSLTMLHVESDKKEELRLHNKALFKAIQFVSGCSIIIDSSKIVRRFVQLQAAGFKVIPIVLYRKPQAVVYSWTKRQHDWWDVAHYYPSFYKDVAKAIPNRKTLQLNYESLVENPEENMAKILDYIGIYSQEIDLNWNKQKHHHLKGNPMRFEKKSTITLSTEWQENISQKKSFWIRLLAFPVKINQYWFYYFWERFMVLFTWKKY